MFEQSLVESGKKITTKKPLTILASFLVQMVAVAILLLVPLLYYDVLPAQQLMSFVTAPPPPPPAPPPPAAEQPRVVRKIVSEVTETGQLKAPKEIPKQIAHIKEEAAPPPAPVGGVVGGVPGGIPGGTAGGVIGGIIGGIPSAAPPPPKPTVQRIRLGGQVAAAKCVSCPNPQYPPLARQARIQGQVVLHAVIAKDGSIQQLQLMNGHPMLVSSAMQAVREWRYSPTLLNGEPVEVDTIITVNFTLSG